MSRMVRCLLAMAMLTLASVGAWAKPEYARKEGRACQFCHTSGSPGYVDPQTGAREATTPNKRGQYYETHNHTFEGYVEKSVMGGQAGPTFRFVWQENMPDAPRRIAVADVTGDGTPRLITLNEKAGSKDSGTLTVKKWDGKAFVTEFTGEVKAPADRLQVGKYAGPNRPAVILTAEGLWYWNGKTFAHKPSAHPLPLLGGTRPKDGPERVLLAETPTTVKAYRVDPTAPGTAWLVDGIEAPNSSQVTWGDMHGTPDFFAQMGMPAVIGNGGVLGVWDVHKFGAMFLYYARISQDFDIKPGADPKSGKPLIEYKDVYGYIALRNPHDPVGMELYSTPRINGLIYDIALEDGKGSGKPGLLILNGDPAGRWRILYFFALD